MSNAVAPMRGSNQEESRRQVYHALILLSAADPNSEWLARMLASQAAGFGGMPGRLGLDSDQFAALVAHHFPGMDHRELEIGAPLEPDRTGERADLRALILEHAAEADPQSAWVAEILAAGCMCDDHLWQDLGLWSREDLSDLIAHNFPALKAKNDRDMKWKKFLYKQLCLQEGIYICRSPSCDVCADFNNCFGPE